MTEEIQNNITREVGPILHEVFAVYATKEPDVLRLSIDLTDAYGERFEADFYFRYGDSSGLSPVIAQWLTDNEGSYVVAPYVPPTPEQIRASLPAVSARQLRLTLVRNSISLAMVNAAIDALEAGPEKEEAEIEWEYATEFARLSPTLLTIGGALGLSPERVDELWEQALAI